MEGGREPTIEEMTMGETSWGRNVLLPVKTFIRKGGNILSFTCVNGRLQIISNLKSLNYYRLDFLTIILLVDVNFSVKCLAVLVLYFEFSRNFRAYSFRNSEYSERVLDWSNISEQCTVFFRT